MFPPEDPEDTAIARDIQHQDDADVRGIRYIIAHEVGHGLHIEHYAYAQGGRLTVMVTEYLDADDDDRWNNVPNSYDATDSGQIRVH